MLFRSGKGDCSQAPSSQLFRMEGVFLKKNSFLILFIFEREVEGEWGRGREREGDTESEAGSRL